jgi:uncharacterized RDD family membrane protein YckC
MISRAMAVATVGSTRFERAADAREARPARLAALIVDTFVFGLITAIVNGVYGVTEVTSGYLAGNASYMTTSTAVAWPWLTLLALLYFTVSEAMFGATPGKQLLRLKIVRLDGAPLTLRDVFVRNILKPVDFLPILYLLGGAFVLATPGAQRLGDIPAGTTVVYRHRALEPGATRTSSPPARRVLVAVLTVAAVVTLLFDYFGRPPLVIEGMYRTGHLVGPRLTGYSLGQPSWGFGTVTYPIRATAPGQTCSGTVELRWAAVGWDESGAQMLCVPS